MKKEVGTVNATPNKRIFTSIIADYNVNQGICELIDNALDIWVKNNKKGQMEVTINLEKNQQIITVIDNSGGIIESELPFIVGPGQTSNLPEDETIGIFGVGTKRAVVALAQKIMITSRYKKEKTHLVEFDDEWLLDPDWHLPYYEVEDIEAGSTVIELHKLRSIVTEEVISQLKEHLQTTYARFLMDKKVNIILNSEILHPQTFENWAYPPKYQPRKFVGDIPTDEGGTVKVEVVAGLNLESSPAGEYGVYFYCNDRLIERSLKSFEVGFTAGLAGKPHPRVSLMRVIVSLKGEAQLMPWNSSKSKINTNHQVFIALRKWLVNVVSEYASLSRRWEGKWPDKVFQYKSGNIVNVKIDSFPKAKKSYLPTLPKSRPRYDLKLKQLNRKIAKEKPWTKGLYEGIAAVDLIFKKHYEQKNRICLIILDSTLEIAFKEYLVNESGARYSPQRLLNLFSNRIEVHTEIEKFVSIRAGLWKKINYYYLQRCNLIHLRSTASLMDSDIEDYRDVVQDVLNILFNLEFED